MLEPNTISDLFANAGKTKKHSCKALFRNVRKKLSETRRMLYQKKDYGSFNDEEEVLRWLSENYSRLEECVKNDMLVLKTLRVLCRKGRNPLVYAVFGYILVRAPRLCEKELGEIFRICNESGDGLDVEDTKSLLPLFRICVCMKICEIFTYPEKEKSRNLGETVRDLFLTLDELLSFDEEKVFASGKIEKIFMYDPYGIYSRLSTATKQMYRKNLVRLSRKRGVPESQLAENIVKHCKENTGNDRHIGRYLCDEAFGGKTYLLLVFFMTFFFTLLLCLVSPVFLVSVFSVYSCAELLANKFFVRFCVKSFSLPSLEVDEIPDGCGVMTVITSLVTGSEREDELFERLEEMYFSNGEKNVYFGLLCDLPDSITKRNEKDEVIIDRAADKILSLRKKYGNRFFLFVREREYSEGEQMYIAPERKRGAVNALCTFLCGKGDDFCFGSIKPDRKICENVKYIFTLDADTNLAFDCLKTMTGIMLHPQNKPVFDREKNAVVKGYGILQPATNPTTEGSAKTFFSSVMCGHGGVDFYSFGGSDSYMSMFGRSIFCGKGMFEKNCFYKALCRESGFAYNSVLSHDAPEGARLRCAYVPYVTLTDSFPSEELSYYKRQHRWIRGDVQNIPFLFKQVKTADGRKITNGIGYASKFFILQNVKEALLPVFTLASLFVSVFCEGEVSGLLQGVALSAYVLPFGYSVLSGAKRRIWHNFRRSYYSERIYTGIWTNFLRMTFRLCAIPKSAFVSLDALARSAYRGLVSRKKMLEWTTAAQNDAEKRDGLLGYVKKNLAVAVCGCILFTLSGTGVVKLLSLFWLFMPVFAYHSGKERRGVRKPLGKKKEELLLHYCRDMWRYFSENVNEKTNHLPPDNLSLYPDRKVAAMTSPTNIGLYLLSVLCAAKLGFVDNKELFCRLTLCLESVESLEKHKGLLYNWYNVFEKRPMMPKYVSSVDLGNYAACLVAVREGIGDFETESEECKKIRALCEKLLSETDVSLLFDNTRKLFYIGAEEREGLLVFDKNRYDMLMSEARILSFYAVSKRIVPSQHISFLSRKLVSGRGYMGLASWSGTAFEFFLPEIFLPSKKGSLLYEAICFAYEMMRRKGVRTNDGYVFGISESCYNELDCDSNYKYYAFGVPEIAVKPFEKENVVSPYSSFLCLKMSPETVLGNLKNLQKMGAYGEYGFYEAVDLERPDDENEYSVVKCFMSHHIGMSLAACTNLVCDSVIAEWFSRDNNVKSALSLTKEKIPYDAYVKKVPRQHYTVKNTKARNKPRILQESDSEKEAEQKETIKQKNVVLYTPAQEYPLNSAEAPFRLASTKAFSFLACENRLGVSFVGDVNGGAITGSDENGGERILLDDGFDLCKNAATFSDFSSGVEYSGEYMKKHYSVAAFACDKMPCKIIVVNGIFEKGVNFSFRPSRNCEGEMNIGAGLVFFGKKESKEKGFAFGVCVGEDKQYGGEYAVSDGITVKLCATRYKAEYVFCIGFADEERAHEIYATVRNNYKSLVFLSRQFSALTTLNEELPDEEMKRVLKKYFVFPEDNNCKRVFIKTSDELFLFDCLLLMYTDFPDKREFFIKAFDREFDSCLSRAIGYLLFCEYVRITSDRSAPELKVRGQTIYKRCIGFAWSEGKLLCEKEIFLFAMERFSRICSDLGDIRTSLSIKEITEKNKGTANEDNFL